MSLTPGSWWVNKRSGQKMAVADRGMRNHSRPVYNERTKRHRYERSGAGRPSDRIACYLEGYGLYLAWLTEDELRGAWKQLRLKPDDGFIPTWLSKPRMNDFLFQPIKPPYKPFEPYWVTVQRIRSGWLCLSGMTQDVVNTTRHVQKDKLDVDGHFDWGIQTYNTFFLPASEAVPLLTPKFDRIQKTVYDHINEGGALGAD